MTDLVTNYLACWNETDTAVRRGLIAQHWTETATYVDPMAEAAGHEALDAVIGAVQRQFPGFVFTAVGDVDAHHDQARFQWGLGPVDAEPVIVGFDVVVTDPQGRFDHVLGFLDRVPE